MSGPDLEQSDLMLAEAAKSDLVLMRHVQALALDSTDAAEVGTLVNAYARVSRCMRQNLALLARQRADRAKAEREAALKRNFRSDEELACEIRAEDLQQAVGKVISAAADGDRRLHADWHHRFDRELDDWFQDPDFAIEPLDDQVVRAARTLGIPDEFAERWEDLPEPTFFPDPAPADPEARQALARDLVAKHRDALAQLSSDPQTPPVPQINSG